MSHIGASPATSNRTRCSASFLTSDKRWRHISKLPDLFCNPRFIQSPLHKIQELCNIWSLSSSTYLFLGVRVEGGRGTTPSFHYFPKHPQFCPRCSRDSAPWLLPRGKKRFRKYILSYFQIGYEETGAGLKRLTSECGVVFKSLHTAKIFGRREIGPRGEG